MKLTSRVGTLTVGGIGHCVPVSQEGTVVRVGVRWNLDCASRDLGGKNIGGESCTMMIDWVEGCRVHHVGVGFS